ncbi:hypothetical protein T492DRAFT_174998 [Pavlovales sp. CCMP2436]|nr:hypothetical protein T492DRAFT_174998 [Pavlovales sp. CCMP2436]
MELPESPPFGGSPVLRPRRLLMLDDEGEMPATPPTGKRTPVSTRDKLARDARETWSWAGSTGAREQLQRDEERLARMKRFVSPGHADAQWVPTEQRGVPISVVLARGARVFSRVSAPASGWRSFKTKRYRYFISHSWTAARLDKYLALLFDLALTPALLSALAAAHLVCVLVGVGVLPTFFTAVFFPDVTHEAVGISLLCTPVGGLVFVAVLFGWVPFRGWLEARGLASKSTCFIDKLCIDQAEIERGVEQIGAFLHNTDTMLLLWSADYFQRLWCVFELAVLLSAQDDEFAKLAQERARNAQRRQRTPSAARRSIASGGRALLEASKQLQRRRSSRVYVAERSSHSSARTNSGPLPGSQSHGNSFRSACSSASRPTPSPSAEACSTQRGSSVRDIYIKFIPLKSFHRR